MKRPIYLDHHSTTPVDERVLAAMLPFFTAHFGNPSSQDHAFGWEAAEAVALAREEIAKFLNASPEEIIFTSGATESNNLAWLGLARAHPHKKHFITCAIEHSAILEVARDLESNGREVTILPVDAFGKIKLSDLENAIRPDTLLVSLQVANNEVGTVQASREIGKICQRKNVFFHTDAAQAGALVEIDVKSDGIDLLSLSAHKMYGPKGIGILYARKNNRTLPHLELKSILHGGYQERGLRPGTLNVPGIVGFAEACKIAARERTAERARMSELTELLWKKLQKIYPEAIRNGDASLRLPNNLHLSFVGLEAESILQNLRTLAISTGAACDSHKREPSHVLKAMSLSPSAIHSSLRFGLGRFTTVDEISEAADRMHSAIRELKCKQ
jgi:cysteine desulfurase